VTLHRAAAAQQRRARDVQALAATLGGTQSLHTNGYDEALALPTAEAATLALRTQQIVAHESGVAQTVTRWPGATTWSAHRRAGAAALALIAAWTSWAARSGRSPRASSRRRSRAARTPSSCAWRRGETVIVGVNRFADGASRRSSRRRLLALERGSRRAAGGECARRAMAPRVDRALAALRCRGAPTARSTPRGTEPLMPLLIDAVRARATVGEIADVLPRDWGAYRPG
jgi:methylmalonyl-CoA mutase, N-terminal domain